MGNHNLDPSVLRPTVIVEDRRLREHREAMDDLLRTARFGVEALYKQVAGMGYVLLLTDSEGITVDYIGDAATTDHLREAGLYIGADWNEARAGTNGTGTCVATGKAMTVHQTDHFDATHIPLSCTVAGRIRIVEGGTTWMNRLRPLAVRRTMFLSIVCDATKRVRLSISQSKKSVSGLPSRSPGVRQSLRNS